MGDEHFEPVFVEPSRGAGDAHGGEDPTVGAEDRGGQAADALLHLFGIYRVALLADALQLALELFGVGYGAGSKAWQAGLPGDGVYGLLALVGQEHLAGAGRVGRYAVAGLGKHADHTV